ncbi:MAG: hypothetical protein NWF00_10920 [Candidatus Bathyarchaeota archaeon]|nr:hypothetical protein [Candidatus Bathyarchaeota archaeon]
MGLNDNIEKGYTSILKLAESFDACLGTQQGTWGRNYEIKPEKTDEYWKVREQLEVEITDWMANIRKSLAALPANVRKFVREEKTDYTTGEIRSYIRYDNSDYKAIVGFFEKVESAIEGYHSVLELIKRPSPILESLKGIRGLVLSLYKTLDVFAPELIVAIDRQVKLVFRLREKGLAEPALLIEELDQIDDNLKKCLNSRTALEKFVEAYCKGKTIDVKKGFYTNLDNAINAGMTEKTKRDAIAAHYSFVSKVIHGDIESNLRNTQFAVNGIINILDSLQFA